MTIQLSRRTVAFALAAFMAFAAVATTSLVLTLSRNAEAGGGFTDTPAWAAPQINWLAANGIAEGYPDGSFRPNLNITRAQAAYWFGNYNNSIEVEEGEFDYGAQSASGFGWFATCPAGKRAIGGGGTTDATDFHIHRTAPFDSGTDGVLDSWSVKWGHKDSSGVIGKVMVYVVCAPNTIP